MIDVEIADRRTLATVLTLMRITQHDVLPGQTHRGSTHSFITTQVEHPRHAQDATDDRERVVGFTYRKTTPRSEIVQFPDIVERMRGIAEKQEKCTSRRGDLNRMKMLVEREYRKRQRITTTGRVMEQCKLVIDLERIVEMTKRVLFGNFSPWRDLSPWHASECSNK